MIPICITAIAGVAVGYVLRWVSEVVPCTIHISLEDVR
jgi:hypothetical protein